MSEFHYKEIDKEGWEILDVISSADQFNEWMYQTIKPWCDGKILEVGSGIGNISQYFLRDHLNLTLSDIRPNYCEVLKKKFDLLGEVVQLDLTHPQFAEIYSQH